MRKSTRFTLLVLMMSWSWANFLLPDLAWSSTPMPSGEINMEVVACDFPPANPTTVNVTSNTATFHWDVTASAISYSVQVRLPGGTWQFVPGSPFTNSTITID